MGRIGHEGVVVQLVLISQGESCWIGISIDVVYLDPIKALLCAHVHPRGHYRTQNRQLPDVEPSLSSPAGDRIP